MEFFLALKYLKGKRKVGFITLITYISALGVFLGTLVLIIALSVANGFEKEVRDRIIGTFADAKILKYFSRTIENGDSLRQEIEKHPHVKSTAPYIMGKAGLESGGVQEGVMVMGVDDSLEVSVSNLHEQIKFGEFNLDTAVSSEGDTLEGILIGSGMADKLGLRPGGEVVIISLVPVEGQAEPVPRMRRFCITGVFETGMYEYDLNLVYTSIKSSQFLFAVDGVEGIQIKTDDLFKADVYAEEIRVGLGGYPYKAEDWKSQNKSLFKWMNLEKLIIFIVISLIMVIAAFNIVSSLIMMILEKRKEIGVLKAMGATSWSIMKIFLFNGVIIGLVGSIAGLSVGSLLCYIQYRWELLPLPGDIYFITTVPVLLRSFDILAIFIAANCLCILAASYPAYYAARLFPAEAIRYEN